MNAPAFPIANPAHGDNVVRGPDSGTVIVGADPATWVGLPDSVRARFLAVRDARDDASAAMHAISEQLQEARLNHQRAQIEFEQRKRELFHPPKEDNLPEWWIGRQKKVDTLGAEVKRLNDRYEALAAEWRPLASLSHRLETYLTQVGAKVREAPTIAAEPRKSETLTAAIERCRRRIRELRADQRTVEAAPYPSSLAKQRAAVQVAELAERGAPVVSPMIDHGEPFRLPAIHARKNVMPDQSGFDTNQTDIYTALAWWDPEQFLAKICSAIDEDADDAAALTDEQRAKRLAEIDRDLLATAREEVTFSAAAGINLREDVDPRAALGLADNMPAPRDYWEPRA